MISSYVCFLPFLCKFYLSLLLFTLYCYLCPPFSCKSQLQASILNSENEFCEFSLVIYRYKSCVSL